MESSNPPSTGTSRGATPNPGVSSRFTSQNATAEDLFKAQTIGLVNLSDFRKRRAEALEVKERESLERASGRATPGSGASTPADGASTPQPPTKKRKAAPKVKLSFGVDEEEEDGSSTSAVASPRARTPKEPSSARDSPAADDELAVPRRKLAPNSSVAFAPKVRTKAVLLKEAQAREQLRKEFLEKRELVKATDFVIPFVFYDGTNIPGGVCRIKKGDHVWLFLDRARKVGAELGVGGDKGRREWARISVDDLMMVRGEMIIPHHFEFYKLIAEKAMGYNGLLFDISAQPTAASPKSTASTPVDMATYDPLARPDKKKDKMDQVPDEELEGFNDEPQNTKVVDRRWYERNKHIYPASIWVDFDPEKDYTKDTRKDAQGNAFFFS